MILNELLHDKKMTKYRLCKESGVPQTTINDLCSGKTKLEKCTVGTLYRISRALHVTLDSMVEAELGDRAANPVATSEPVMKITSEKSPGTSERAMPKGAFADFRNQIRQQLEGMGDLDFILSTMKKDEIRKLYQEGELPEAFYLLGMLDYLSRANSLPMYASYNDIRSQKLPEILFPDAEGELTDQYKKDALKEAIPEFLRFNIVETQIRDM